RYFDRADTAFVAAYRKTAPDASFEVRMDYAATPALGGRTLILIDPMLATGRSLVRAHEALVAHGSPQSVHVVAAVATPAGLDYTQEHLPEARFWCGAIDEGLNDKNYIVPGLGDAGDLAYGPKI
ncbi:MAG: uracil phosphoribosyltransferase, partial [Catalinimonas sp.]